MIDANARTEAEPEAWVSHQTMVNWTSLLPKREKACPAKTTENRVIDLPEGASATVIMGNEMGRLLFNVPLENGRCFINFNVCL